MICLEMFSLEICFSEIVCSVSVISKTSKKSVSSGVRSAKNKQDKEKGMDMVLLAFLLALFTGLIIVFVGLGVNMWSPLFMGVVSGLIVGDVGLGLEIGAPARIAPQPVFDSTPRTAWRRGGPERRRFGPESLKRFASPARRRGSRPSFARPRAAAPSPN
jgi:hypothetical protein